MELAYFPEITPQVLQRRSFEDHSCDVFCRPNPVPVTQATASKLWKNNSVWKYDRNHPTSKPQ